MGAFDEVDAWDISEQAGRWLPPGRFLVDIIGVEDKTASTSGNPIAAFTMQEAGGERQTQFRCPYSAEFLRKIAAVYDAAGLPRPKEGEYNPEDRCRIKDAKLRQLIGTRVGVVIEDEPDREDPAKKWARVQGCVPPNQITGGPDTRGLPTSQAPVGAATAGAGDQDIPF